MDFKKEAFEMTPVPVTDFCQMNDPKGEKLDWDQSTPEL